MQERKLAYKDYITKIKSKHPNNTKEQMKYIVRWLTKEM